ncbi:MAG TPA: MBOAT family protein [Candidatus Phocaeicola excrementigallinarum]|nr:MBOAT family protein [Candidatus Phocaeicola excrementigallinarum]
MIPEIDWNKVGEVLTYDPHQPMIFNSGLFVFLFLGFSLVYVLLRNRMTARLLFVTLFSYYFYYKSSGLYFFLLGIVTVSDFLLARQMDRTVTRWKRKALVVASLCVNLGLLCYFKYTNFFYEMLAPLWNGSFRPLDIFLPVGISFFTFQSLSYTLDVYRRDLKPLDSLLDYAFYVSFFPQLVAGPIVRARDFVPQIRRPLFVSSEMFGQGVFFIVSGLFKKAVVSDYISVNFVERIFDNPALYSGLENLFGVYGYALQIYCDFSGYSDMAIGLALLLGFHFPMNFNSPYKAESVTDFWHRWHISLSTWLRDYLYISLGGNRKGKIRTYVNLMLTMLLGGLWHGASWNFIVWGGLHGAALALHKFFRNATGRPKTYHSTGLRRLFAVVVTFHFVCFCWIFFRNSTFEASTVMIRQIFTAFHPELFMQLVTGYWQVFVLMASGFLLHWCPDSWQDACGRAVTRLPLVGQALLVVAVVYLVIQVKSSDIQPFIYFQF